MSQQEQIEKNVRLALGDMHLQLIVANANIAEQAQRITALELQLAAVAEPELPIDDSKVNGKGKADAKDSRDKPN